MTDQSNRLATLAPKIDMSALDAWFPGGVPVVAAKIMFPEKSDPLTTAEVRHVLAALAAVAHPSPDTEARGVREALEKEAAFYEEASGQLDGIPYRHVAHVIRVMLARLFALSPAAPEGREAVEAKWQREHDALGELIRLLDDEPSIGDAEMADALEVARSAWDHSPVARAVLSRPTDRVTEAATRDAIRAELVKLANRGELTVWVTDDDRGLEIDEYADLIVTVLSALSPAAPEGRVIVDPSRALGITARAADAFSRPTDRVTEAAGIYIASKTKHGPRWEKLRAEGVPIISTWIDEYYPGATEDWASLWVRCVREASSARALVLYREEGEVLKGAWLEAGAALACGVPVFAVGCDEFNARHHPGITLCDSLDAALSAALAARRQQP